VFVLIRPRKGDFLYSDIDFDTLLEEIELARQLASQGWASARFDAPGIGDSVAAALVMPVEALRADLDALQAATGCSHFVIGGICSAADLAWATAQVDPRVRGIVMLDGMARGARAYRWGQLNLLLRYRSPLRWPISRSI